VDIHLQNPVEDAELTRALADVMGHLRKRQYGDVMEHLGGALRGSGDAFIDTLARHLLYEERVLFPSLRTIDSQTAEDVKSLQAEHGRLRELATELARTIKAEDFQQGYDVARTFLAELYDHIGHEARVTDRTTGGKPPA
jgi:iron-sulfur cluster repair protein YtfE (RIC family)